MSHGIHTTRATRALALTAAFLLTFWVLSVSASPAHAHDELLGSSPAAEATVEGLPTEITLTFSAAIATDAGASEVQVTDAAGTSLVAEAPTAQDNVLTQALEGEASGPVTVLWKVVSSDGHPISGQYAFTVTAPPTPTDTPTPTAVPTPSSEPSESAEPSSSATPTAPPADEDATAASAWPWILGGLIIVAVAGAVVYLLVSRARRRKALEEGRSASPQPGSGPPAER